MGIKENAWHPAHNESSCDREPSLHSSEQNPQILQFNDNMTQFESCTLEWFTKSIAFLLIFSTELETSA